MRQIARLCLINLFAINAGFAFALPAPSDQVMQMGGNEASPSQVGACEKSEPTMDPGLSPDWLKQRSSPGSKPTLIVGYYNASQGLLAGYEASNGVRVLLNSVLLRNGGVSASATHLNPRTGRLQTFYGPRKAGESVTGNIRAHVQFAGVDVLQYLKDARSRGFGRQADAVNDFLDSESGQAFFEAVPALYASLELIEADDSKELAALQAPFGVLVTGLQIATKRYAGFPQADALLGRAHADELRASCHSNSCEISGKRFVVHKNGLFDVVSKGNRSRSKNEAGKCVGGASAYNPSFFLRVQQKNGDGNCTEPGDCFGRCGRGCDGQTWAGNYYTAECWGHDLCVCKWGDAACVALDPNNLPGGECDGCNDVIDAVISWLGAVYDDIVNWLEGGWPPDEEETDVINFP